MAPANISRAIISLKRCARRLFNAAMMGHHVQIDECRGRLPPRIRHSGRTLIAASKVPAAAPSPPHCQTSYSRHTAHIESWRHFRPMPPAIIDVSAQVSAGRVYFACSGDIYYYRTPFSRRIFGYQLSPTPRRCASMKATRHGCAGARN